MLSLRDAEGRILCPEHRIEHSGKNAGLIVMACELARLPSAGDRDVLFEIARTQARRLLGLLQREGESTCFTFRPGRHDPYNCSNNVIDGAAAADALATFVQCFGPRLEPKEREACAHAAVLHAQTYLRYAILDKAIPAQRAWAMTGVAQAHALAGHDVLERAVIEGAGILEALQHEDGSYPYHPQRLTSGDGDEFDRGAPPPHPGASDVSAFYQSRVTGFLIFALECLGREVSDDLWRTPIERGLSFLSALQAPDGTKVGLVEAKPWYWGAPYEVASHPFDVWALARGWRHFHSPHWGQAALRAFRSWCDHLEATGRPRSHRPAPGHSASYQCPLFWAGHASWMARAMADLAAIDARGDALMGGTSSGAKGLEIGLIHFPQASLVRLEDNAIVAWVRGRRPAFNLHHGSPLGAGLVRVWSRREARDVLERWPLSDALEGEWSGRAGFFSMRRGLRAGQRELRFSAWLARNEWRRGRPSAALNAPWHALRRGVLDFAAPEVGSAWACDPDLTLLADGVELESRLARRDGSALESTRLTRRFRVDGEGLLAEERLLAEGAARAVRYRLPARAQEARAGPREAQWRLS